MPPELFIFCTTLIFPLIYTTRYTLQGRGAKHPLHPRPQGLPSSYIRIPEYVTGEPRTPHGVRFELAARLGRTPAKYECDVDDRFFLRFRKKAPNWLQKRARNGSPSVPLLSLKARFWRFYFSFFQIAENPCLKVPSVLSNVHPPIYQSQKSIISRTDGRTNGQLWFSGLGRKERFAQKCSAKVLQ